ncbi:hypothetical protein [Luteimicrobium sp. DT211]|uniref:hypothetical protein n=1 Tax=Luteimicrobium sp. DT211 TaxID=3393412 RepID=UPI003CF7B3B7
MSSSVTVRPVRGVRGIGLFSIIVGIIMILAGGVTYGMVTSQLRDENITVSDDAQFFGGARVQDPLTAYSQAEVINKHALAMTGGKTYAELPQDDPSRATVMNASFLRASLFTSVVAFGVALLVVACGLLFLLIGIALRRLGRGDVSVLDVVPAGAAGASAAPVAPVRPSAPVTPAEPTRPAAPPREAAAPPVERTSARAATPPESPAPSSPAALAAAAPAAAAPAHAEPAHAEPAHAEPAHAAPSPAEPSQPAAAAPSGAAPSATPPATEPQPEAPLSDTPPSAAPRTALPTDEPEADEGARP